MSDRFTEQLAQASRHIDAGFEARDVERGLAGLERRLANRRRAARSAFVFAAAATTALAILQWRAREPAPPTAAAPSARALATSDGSIATLLDRETALSVQRDVAGEVALELRRGRGHFEVTANPKRRYRVHAGPVDVEVLGTAFDVERRGERVKVGVDHGVVRVSWSSGSATLRAGESGTFPPPLAAATAVSRDAPAAAAPDSAKSAPRESWRALARAGKHQAAFGSLGKRSVEDLPGLLLAADAARLSGHPRQATRYLEHIVQRYPKSASAPLAAFTLGRLALYELKQPGLAARSFARAYALDPKGPMAEDALAREAEAYHRAGDAQRSKSAAERYLERFPRGARRKDMSDLVPP